MIQKLQQIPNSIENKFWEIVIPMLQSDDETIELMVNLGYQLSKKVPGKYFLIKAIFWIFMGTIVGLGLGLWLI